MSKRIEGYVDNGKGAPLPNISAIVTRVDDGGIVTSGLTDADGHWVFSGLAETEEYFVNLADGAGNAIVRGPWSGELREAWVRDRLALPDTGHAVLPNGGNTTVGGLPLVLDPNPANVLEWGPAGIYSAGAVGLTQELADTLYEPIDSAYTKAESDARYEPFDSAYTKAESDARYAELTDVDPFPQYLTPTEANALYEPFDSAYTKAESDARYTQGGITQSAADLRYEPLDSAYTKSEDDARFVNLAGGSVMTGLLGPSTHNTRDLGTTGTRWRALYGMTGDFTTSLTVATKPITPSPDAANIIEFRANGLYAAAGAVTDIWVNTTGDTMTGDLNMTANILPTVTNVRSLGSTSLRWLKVWAQDADFTNAPTVGGSALLTSTTADALFLTPAEGNAAYAALAHNHDATYVQLTGGSVMTGLLGPTTTNTRDLGTTALRWRKLWAVDGEFTNAPTVGGVAVLTATSAGLLYEPLDSAYTKAEDDARFVNLAGGSVMTGLLGPTTTNTRDLGTSTLRWRKLWGVDTDLSGAATVAGVISNGAAAPYTLLTDVTNGRVWVNARNTSRGPMYYSGPALIVQTEHTDGAMILNIQGYGMGTGAPQFGIYRAKGTSASPTDLSNGDWLGSIDYWGYGGGAFRESVRLIGIADGAPGASWVPGQLSVRVVDSAGTLTERLRVNSAGVVNAVTALQVNSRPVIMAGCRVYSTAGQVITTATPTPVAFEAERYDTDNFHDTVTNNNRLTVPAGLAGKYLIVGYVGWNASATGRRDALIRINGSNYVAASNVTPPDAAAFVMAPVTAIYDLAAGDYVELIVQHFAGANLALAPNLNYSSQFSMQRIG